MFVILEERANFAVGDKAFSELEKEITTEKLVIKHHNLFQDIMTRTEKIDPEITLLFENILGSVDCHASRSKKVMLASYWFSVQVRNGVDIFLKVPKLDYIDKRIRMLITHRVILGATGVYHILNLGTGKAVTGKLGVDKILDKVEEVNKPLTPEELEELEKECEGP